MYRLQIVLVPPRALDFQGSANWLSTGSTIDTNDSFINNGSNNANVSAFYSHTGNYSRLMLNNNRNKMLKKMLLQRKYHFESNCKKILLFTNPQNNLLQLSQDIFDKISKMYPDFSEDLNILSIQDKLGNDLDCEFIVRDVFNIDNIVHVLIDKDIDWNSQFYISKYTNIKRRRCNPKIEVQFIDNSVATKNQTTVMNSTANPRPNKSIGNNNQPLRRKSVSRNMRISTPLVNEIPRDINNVLSDDMMNRSVLHPPSIPQSPGIRISSGIDQSKRILSSEMNPDTVSKSEIVDPDKSKQHIKSNDHYNLSSIKQSQQPRHVPSSSYLGNNKSGTLLGTPRISLMTPNKLTVYTQPEQPIVILNKEDAISQGGISGISHSSSKHNENDKNNQDFNSNLMSNEKLNTQNFSTDEPREVTKYNVPEKTLDTTKYDKAEMVQKLIKKNSLQRQQSTIADTRGSPVRNVSQSKEISEHVHLADLPEKKSDIINDADQNKISSKRKSIMDKILEQHKDINSKNAHSTIKGAINESDNRNNFENDEKLENNNETHNADSNIVKVDDILQTQEHETGAPESSHDSATVKEPKKTLPCLGNASLSRKYVKKQEEISVPKQIATTNQVPNKESAETSVRSSISTVTDRKPGTSIKNNKTVKNTSIFSKTTDNSSSQIPSTQDDTLTQDNIDSNMTIPLTQPTEVSTELATNGNDIKLAQGVDITANKLNLIDNKAKPAPPRSIATSLTKNDPQNYGTELSRGSSISPQEANTDKQSKIPNNISKKLTSLTSLSDKLKLDSSIQLPKASELNNIEKSIDSKENSQKNTTMTEEIQQAPSSANSSFQKSDLLDMFDTNNLSHPPWLMNGNTHSEKRHGKSRRKPYITVLHKDIDNSKPDPRNILPSRTPRNAARKAAEKLSGKIEALSVEESDSSSVETRSWDEEDTSSSSGIITDDSSSDDIRVDEDTDIEEEKREQPQEMSVESKNKIEVASTIPQNKLNASSEKVTTTYSKKRLPSGNSDITDSLRGRDFVQLPSERSSIGITKEFPRSRKMVTEEFSIAPQRNSKKKNTLSSYSKQSTNENSSSTSETLTARVSLKISASSKKNTLKDLKKSLTLSSQEAEQKKYPSRPHNLSGISRSNSLSVENDFGKDENQLEPNKSSNHPSNDSINSLLTTTQSESDSNDSLEELPSDDGRLSQDTFMSQDTFFSQDMYKSQDIQLPQAEEALQTKKRSTIRTSSMLHPLSKNTRSAFGTANINDATQLAQRFEKFNKTNSMALEHANAKSDESSSSNTEIESSSDNSGDELDFTSAKLARSALKKK